MTTRPQFGPAVEICAAADGRPAEWVQLFPAGPAIAARDGRGWTLDAATVAAAFDAPVAVDIEHATQVKGAQGEAAPAVGWIEAVEARAGALWGRVAWLSEGAELVGRRAYRFLSPAFTHDASRRIGRLVSAGLTNTPALRMAALAREDHSMDLTRLRQALGLAEDAGPEEMEARAAELAARPATERVDMARFAPRADLEQALARAAVAEGRLAEQARERLDAEIAEAVDGAVKAGKIAPVSRDFYVDACRADGGLEKFRAMVAKAPALVTPADPAPKPSGPGADGLTPEDVTVATAMGIDRAEFAKLKTEGAA